MGADDLYWGVVSSGFLAQVGIVGGEKIFVEVKPGILGTSERGWRYDRDHAQEQIEGSGYIGICVGIRQYLQCPRQQVVLDGEGSFGTIESERIGPFAAA